MNTATKSRKPPKGASLVARKAAHAAKMAAKRKIRRAPYWPSRLYRSVEQGLVFRDKAQWRADRQSHLAERIASLAFRRGISQRKVRNAMLEILSSGI